jgi:ribonuclease J
LNEQEADRLPPDKVLMICTGSQGEPRSALARMANDSHPKVKLRPDDTIIFSSRMIPGNEEKIHELQDMLMAKGLTVITDADDFTHVSGHPNRDELKDMYNWTRPQILVPVHGERSHIREHAAFGKQCQISQTITPSNGVVWRLSKEAGAEKVCTVHVGRWGLDGNQLVPLNSDELRKRERLRSAGAIFVTLLVRKNGALATKPHISTVGLGSESEMTELIDTLNEVVAGAMKNDSDKTLKSKERIEEQINHHVQELVVQVPLIGSTRAIPLNMSEAQGNRSVLITTTTSPSVAIKTTVILP